MVDVDIKKTFSIVDVETFILFFILYISVSLIQLLVFENKGMIKLHI